MPENNKSKICWTAEQSVFAEHREKTWKQVSVFLHYCVSSVTLKNNHAMRLWNICPSIELKWKFVQFKAAVCKSDSFEFFWPRLHGV